MTPISFFAEGIPKGQPRPRAFAMGGKARVYDPGTAEGWKSAVAVAARPFLAGRITEPVRFSCMFVFPRPKSHYFTGKRANILRDDAPMYNVGKPDIDNALVILGLIADDALIVQIESAKLYAAGSRTGALISIQSADELFANTFSISETSASFKPEDPAKASGIPGVPFPGAEIPSAQNAVIQAVTGP